MFIICGEHFWWFVRTNQTSYKKKKRYMIFVQFSAPHNITIFWIVFFADNCVNSNGKPFFLWGENSMTLMQSTATATVDLSFWFSREVVFVWFVARCQIFNKFSSASQVFVFAQPNHRPIRVNASLFPTWTNKRKGGSSQTTDRPTKNTFPLGTGKKACIGL